MGIFLAIQILNYRISFYLKVFHSDWLDFPIHRTNKPDLSCDLFIIDLKTFCLNISIPRQQMHCKTLHPKNCVYYYF